MKKDTQIFDLINAEYNRQLNGIELIASENYVSPAVLELGENSSTMAEYWDNPNEPTALLTQVYPLTGVVTLHPAGGNPPASNPCFKGAPVPVEGKTIKVVESALLDS